MLDVAVPGEMNESWCSLLREGAPPLSLAPLVFCTHSDKTSRHEVFVARKLASVEPAGKVEGVGVASTSVMKVG